MKEKEAKEMLPLLMSALSQGKELDQKEVEAMIQVLTSERSPEELKRIHQIVELLKRMR